MCTALKTSVEIGLLATLGATILGTLAAFALVRHQFVGRSATNMLIFLPMAAPEIVMGSSLLALFVAGGFAGQLGFCTILIAHIMFCLSFVIVTVRSRLAGLSDTLEQAAADLYATPQQAFWKVTFPLVFPGILGAALLAFSLSFDDFIITNLNAGTRRRSRCTSGASRGAPSRCRSTSIGTVMLIISVRDRGRRRGAQPAPDAGTRRPGARAPPTRSWRRPALARPPGTSTPSDPVGHSSPGSTDNAAAARQWRAAARGRTVGPVPSDQRRGLGQHLAQDLLDLVEVLLVADQRGSELDDGVAPVVGAAVEARVVERLGEEAAEAAARTPRR